MAVRETILRAGDVVGRAQPLGQAGPDAFGAGIGRGMAELGGELHQARVRSLDRERRREEEAEASRAAVDFARLAGDIDVVRNTKREEALPDAAGHVQAVDDELKARAETFLGSIKSDRIRQRFAPEVEQLRSRLIGDEDGWARGRRVKALGDNVEEAGRLWDNQLLSNPDPTAFEQSLTAVDTLIATLDVPQAVGEKLARSEKGRRATSYVQGLLESAPEAGLATLQSGLLDQWLDPDVKARLIDAADVEIRTAAAELRREQAAARSQAQSSIDLLQKRLADHDPTITDAELEEAQALATAAGLPKEIYDIAKARTLLAVEKEYNNPRSPASSLEIANAIDALDTRIRDKGDKASPDDVLRRDHLQSLLDKREAEERSDPLSAAGVAVAPVAPGDARSIRARAAAASSAFGVSGQYAFFKPQEVAQLKGQIASGPDGRLGVINFLAEIAEVDPQAALRAAAQIDPDDRTLRHALRGVSPAVREMVVRGTVARTTLPSRAIGPDGKIASLDALTESWFAENVGPALVRSRPEFADDVLETARALYADWRRRTGTAGQDEEFNAEQFRRAVNLALGGAGGRGGVGRWSPGPKRSAGGPFPFVLPSRISQDEFEERMSNPLVAAGIAKAPQGSVNGTPAWGSGKAMSLKELRERFVPVVIADGIYQFHAGGRVVMTVPEEGRPPRPFQVDVRRMPPFVEPKKPDPAGGSRLAPRPAVPTFPRPKVRGPVWIGPGGEQ